MSTAAHKKPKEGAVSSTAGVRGYWEPPYMGADILNCETSLQFLKLLTET